MSWVFDKMTWRATSFFKSCNWIQYGHNITIKQLAFGFEDLCMGAEKKTTNMAGHAQNRWQSWRQVSLSLRSLSRAGDCFHLNARASRCLCGASAFLLKQSQWASSSSVRGEAEAMRSRNASCVNVVGGGRDGRGAWKEEQSVYFSFSGECLRRSLL